MPYITQFDSISNLEKLVDEIDTNEISKKMSEFNILRKNRIYKLWENFLNNIQ
jgi:hypothetical protein